MIYINWKKSFISFLFYFFCWKILLHLWNLSWIKGLFKDKILEQILLLLIFFFLLHLSIKHKSRFYNFWRKGRNKAFLWTYIFLEIILLFFFHQEFILGLISELWSFWKNLSILRLYFLLMDQQLLVFFHLDWKWTLFQNKNSKKKNEKNLWK
jgi:hypothetical protein